MLDGSQYTLDPHISGKTERPSAVQHTIDMYNMNGEILLKLKSDTYKETIIIDRNQYLVYSAAAFHESNLQ